MNAPHHDHRPRVRATTAATTATAAKVRCASTKHHELLRLVRALSGACRSDSNVLKDAQLVDLLESQAKTILQTRRQQRRKSATASEFPTISPQRTKLIKKLADANADEGSSVAASKRRKLSFESETQKRPASPIKVAMPLRSVDKAFSNNSTSMSDPAAHDKTDAFASASSGAVSVFHANMVDYSSSNSSVLSHEQPSRFKADDAAGAPFKSLDHASVSAVDLSASMASTVTSASAGYYDDMFDDLADSRYRRAHSPGMDSRGSYSPLTELTQSVDSIDWSPSDDEDDEDDEELAQHTKTARSASPLGFDTRDAAAAVPVTPAMAQSTEVVMQVLYSIMREDHKYKWLVDPENQARVAKLVAYHQHQQEQSQEQHKDTDERQSTTVESAAVDLQTRVDELVRENARIASENQRLAEANAMSACDLDAQQQRVQTLRAQLETATAAASLKPAQRRTDAETRLRATEAQLEAQEAIRREAEAAFSSALNAKNATVTSLKHDVAAKETEIESLMEHVDAMSAAFVAKSLARSESSSSLSAVEAADESMIAHLRSVTSAREAEVQRLRALVTAKDREICNLYMHLSTKKTLVDELTSSFLQQVQNVAAARGESLASLTREDLDLNVDMFVFTSAVAKQKAADELTAALGVLEREVETLEARVEALESENYALTVTREDAASVLESANAELARVSAENELMETSLSEKQTRIRNLMLYLEEKEDQIMRLQDAASASAPRSSPGAFATY